MKTLKFANDLVPLVLAGEKTRTWRLFDDKDLQVGDDLILINKLSLAEFALAKIVAIKEKPMGRIEEADFVGHELFTDHDEMLATYRSYYGDRVTEETMIKIVDFKLINSLSK